MLLKQHARDWVPYRHLDGIKLRALLKDRYEVKVPSTDNQWPVSPKLIADALARRTD